MMTGTGHLSIIPAKAGISIPKGNLA